MQEYTIPIDLDKFLDGVDLSRLKAVFDDVMRRSREKQNDEAIRYGKIKREVISMPEKLTYIRNYTRRHKHFSFRKLIEEQMTRENIIVTFLAVLELIKNGQLIAVQEGENDIQMYSPEEAPDSVKVAADDVNTQ